MKPDDWRLHPETTTHLPATGWISRAKAGDPRVLLTTEDTEGCARLKLEGEDTLYAPWEEVPEAGCLAGMWQGPVNGLVSVDGLLWPQEEIDPGNLWKILMPQELIVLACRELERTVARSLETAWQAEREASLEAARQAGKTSIGFLPPTAEQLARARARVAMRSVLQGAETAAGLLELWGLRDKITQLAREVA